MYKFYPKLLITALSRTNNKILINREKIIHSVLEFIDGFLQSNGNLAHSPLPAPIRKSVGKEISP